MVKTKSIKSNTRQKSFVPSEAQSLTLIQREKYEATFKADEGPSSLLLKEIKLCCLYPLVMPLTYAIHISWLSTGKDKKHR